MKMKFIYFSLFLTCLTISSVICDQSSTDNDVYIIEQSIGELPFREIGTVNLRAIKQNQNAAHYHSLNTDDSIDQPRQQPLSISTPLDSNKLDQDVLEQLQNELSKSNDSLYRLRLCRKQSNGENLCYAASFTYLKNVIESNLNLNLTLHTNANNRLNSISIKTPNNWKKSSNKDHVTFHVYVQNLKTALPPDTESYLDKVKKEMEQKEKAAQGDNQSFLSKYWIYIVPFVIIMFLSNIINPEAAAGGAGGGGGR